MAVYDSNPKGEVLELNSSTTSVYDSLNASKIQSLESLEAINASEVILLLPVIVFYVIIMVIGIVGNIFVLIIYTYRFKRISARFYILSLAMLDLCVCLIGIPYHLLDLLHPYTYFYSDACKSLTFLITFFTYGSIYVLLVVGVDRFLKICRPLKKQLADFGPRKACLFAVLLGLLSACPQAVIYGHSSAVPSGHVNITGVECFVDDSYKETYYPLIYIGFTFFIAVSTIITLIVLYSFICYQIYMHDKYQGDILRTIVKSRKSTYIERNNHTNVTEAGSFTEEEFQHIPLNTFDMNSQKGGQMENIILEREVTPDRNSDSSKSSNGTIQSTRTSSMDPIRSRSRSKSPLEVAPSRSRNNIRKGVSLLKSIKSVKGLPETAAASQKKQKTTRKITLMMFSITIMFIVSYIPYIAMSVADILVEDLWEGIDATRLVIYDICLRSYVINNMVNPIIYGFWDDRFRSECIRLIKGVVFCHLEKRRGTTLTY
ncbi:hypothetical protein ACJMK2_003944 [Sinanodonta woodiana]|uniref:G-protein coupled receptors family 1 profile domain-containing protein n=1 Tax=Sinanodonta woodiana TaxID=1069815 RepID=A0ABD3XZQ4_SINWO